MSDALREQVASGLAALARRIEAAGGDPERVRVLAVTKGFGPEAVRAALGAGLPEVGENYAQELVEKRAALGDAPVRWHYLGAIQTNKVPLLGPVVDCWQSLSRPREAERIAAVAPGARVLVQVAFSTEAGRPGCEPAAVPGLVAEALALGLFVEGLMAVAPRPPEEARAAFALVRSLADRLSLPVRSMGMTEDLELAVAEGSTMVRVGRGLFGPRHSRRAWSPSRG